MINVVKNYSDAQVKVRKATSNEPWGPSSTLMSEIADLTYNVVAFSEIMQIVWKRLNDHGKNWRHVYKALVLLEYLIKTGSEEVAQQCRDNLFAIQPLKDFQYFEDSKDQGLSIREKSKLLVGLLKDEEKLKTERIWALKAKDEAEQKERLRKNEYLRLKLALEESLKGKALAAVEAAANQQPRSAVDYLLSLVPVSNGGELVACDPWGSPLNGNQQQQNGTSAFLPTLPNNNRGQQLQSQSLVDPWGAPLPQSSSSFETDRAFDDPWAGDPWGAGGSKPSSTSPAANDPWNLNNGNGEVKTNDFLGGKLLFLFALSFINFDL